MRSAIGCWSSETFALELMPALFIARPVEESKNNVGLGTAASTSSASPPSAIEPLTCTVLFNPPNVDRPETSAVVCEPLGPVFTSFTKSNENGVRHPAFSQKNPQGCTLTVARAQTALPGTICKLTRLS